MKHTELTDLEYAQLIAEQEQAMMRKRASQDNALTFDGLRNQSTRNYRRAIKKQAKAGRK